MQNQRQLKPAREINFTLIIIAVVAVALTLAAVLKLFTPQQDKVISSDFVVTNYDDTQTTYKKINYTGVDLVPPENFNIYQSQTGSEVAQALADNLIIANDLTKNDQINNYWLGEKSSLIKSSYDNSYTFKNSLVEDGSKSVTVIPSEAIKVCDDFYKKYNVSVDLVPQENGIVYLDSRFEQNVVDQNKATFIQIPLTYELDGYPVFYENQNDYPFYCRVDNQYNIERVVFKNFLQKFSLSRSIPHISVKEAVNNIKKGNASIIDAKSNIVSAIDLNWINEAELYSVVIEYRYDSKLQIAYPFYRFGANLTNSSGINIKAEIITPAVASAVEK